MAACIEQGAGALNIDGTRVGFQGDSDRASAKPGGKLTARTGALAGKTQNPDQKRTEFTSDNNKGRWPANLILQHRASCTQTGSTTAPGYTINRWTDGAKPFGGGAGHEYESEKQPDESVAVWECATECAIGLLNRDAGVLTSGGGKKHPVGSKIYGRSSYLESATAGDGSDWQASKGTASRFFQQVQETTMNELPQELVDYLETMITPPDGEVLIVPDVSAVNWTEYDDNQLHGVVVIGKRADEFKGNDYLDQIYRVLRPGAHVAMIASDEQPTGHTNTCALEDQGFEIRDALLVVQEPGRIHYVAKAATAERNAGVAPIKQEVTVERWFPKDDADLDEIMEALAESLEPEQIDEMEVEGLDKKEVPKHLRDQFESATFERTITHQNNHPTCKPIAVMERLLANVPEGAVVCDPFMGSGTTGIACLNTNHSFIGIDLEEPHVKIADARIRHWDTKKRRTWVAEIESEVEPEKQDDPFGGMFGG